MALGGGTRGGLGRGLLSLFLLLDGRFGRGCRKCNMGSGWAFGAGFSAGHRMHNRGVWIYLRVSGMSEVTVKSVEAARACKRQLGRPPLIHRSPASCRVGDQAPFRGAPSNRSPPLEHPHLDVVFPRDSPPETVRLAAVLTTAPALPLYSLTAATRTTVCSLFPAAILVFPEKPPSRRSTPKIPRLWSPGLRVDDPRWLIQAMRARSRQARTLNGFWKANPA